MIIAAAMLTTGCSRETPPNPAVKASGNSGRLAEAERIVKIGWDPPAVAPYRYRISVDDRVVQEIPPPPLNSECGCLLVPVSIPPGAHVVKVVAQSADGGDSIPATLTVQ